MRYTPNRVIGDWELHEISVGERLPCSDAFANAKDDDLVNIYGELRLLRAAGCPPDRHRGNPEVERWKRRCKGAQQDVTFWVLKAKPSGWRLYFFAPDPSERRIVFLYAVNKKRNDRNPKDFQRLCNLRDKLTSGRASTEPLYFPDR